MVIKEEYLVKRNNKNRIQVILMQLSTNHFDKTFILHRTIFQYEGKRRDAPIINIKLGQYGKSVEQTALWVFSEHLRNYMNIGYYPLSKLTSKHYDNFSEDELKELIAKRGHKLLSPLPVLMEAKNYSQCSPGILEKECYCTPNIEGIHVTVLWRDNRINIYNKKRCINENLEHITKDPDFIELFLQIPELIFDGYLYKQSWSQQKIEAACNSRDGSQLQLWIVDYITDKPFQDRVKYLELLRPNIERESIKILLPIKSEGWLKVKRIHDNFLKDGFPGVIIKFPNRPYGEGKTSARYLLVLKSFKEASFIVADVIQDGFSYKDTCFIIITKNGTQLKVPAKGEDDTLKDFLNNKRQYIGKSITCMFLQYSKEGLPVNPSFKCLN